MIGCSCSSRKREIKDTKLGDALGSATAGSIRLSSAMLDVNISKNVNGRSSKAGWKMNEGALTSAYRTLLEVLGEAKLMYGR